MSNWQYLANIYEIFNLLLIKFNENLVWFDKALPYYNSLRNIFLCLVP